MNSNNGIFNWGLKEKILSIVMMGVLTLCVLSYFSYTKFKEIDSHVDDIGHEHLPTVSALGEIKAYSHAIPRFMWLALAFENMPQDRKKALAKVNESISGVLDNVDKVSKFELNTDIKTKLIDLTVSVNKLKEELPKAISYLETNNPAQDKLAKVFLMQTMPPLALKVSDLIAEIIVLNQNETDDQIKASDASVDAAVTKLLWVSICASLGLLSFGGWLAFHLSRQMFRITEEVATASSQVASASEQLARTSESLSSASQEQASSIEETSASLTEITGMVESNVKNAEGSNNVATEVHCLSEETRQFMESLAEAMKGILDSNGKIEKLVKVIEGIGEKTEVIDDIVFKTQLLSFNASVEAERAGEHGRGFAVVAQEVGNLAQMSGKAATEIAGIVKTSIKEAESVAQENKVKVEKGEDLAVETKNRMVDVLKKITEILDGTNRIVIASKEQSQGINQISQSVEVLNKATQETASTAEESSSASHELSSQAETLMSLVGEMRKIITGVANHETQAVPVKRSAGSGKSSAKVISFHKKNAERNMFNTETNNAEVINTEVSTNVPSHTDEAWEKI